MCELTIWLSKITTAIYEAGESYDGPRAVATVTRDRGKDGPKLRRPARPQKRFQKKIWDVFRLQFPSLF